MVSNLRRITQQHAASLLLAHEMGVPIIAGSDAGSYGVAHGHGLLWELELMERAGLPALAVVNTTTRKQFKPARLSRTIRPNQTRLQEPFHPYPAFSLKGYGESAKAPACGL